MVKQEMNRNRKMERLKVYIRVSFVVFFIYLLKNWYIRILVVYIEFDVRFLGKMFQMYEKIIFDIENVWFFVFVFQILCLKMLFQKVWLQ